jgi:hypothetical protein
MLPLFSANCDAYFSTQSWREARPFSIRHKAAAFCFPS